jgi:hypothetical protein
MENQDPTPDDPLWANAETPAEPELPSFGGIPVPPPAEEPVTASSIYARELPPDNEHGDGVRNPADRPCAGIKGNGLLTPKIYNAAEDWKDYNYSDFGY